MEQSNGVNGLAVVAADLAADLATAKTAHKEVMRAFGRGCEAAIQAGEALLRIKGAVGHGEFMDFCEDVCGIPGRTGRRYMWLAEQKPALEQRLGGKMASLADLSQSEAMRMIGGRRPAKATKAIGPKAHVGFDRLKRAWFGASEDVRRQFREAVLGIRPE